MNRAPVWLLVALIIASGMSATSSVAQDYRRAVETKDNVRGKLFPKAGTLELNGPDFGMILNQSYIETFLLHGGLTYYTSETWGFGAEAAIAMNSDKSERECIENFFNNPGKYPSASCPNEEQQDPPRDGNFGPAYVPIREIKMMFAGNAIWTPVYGKQIMFMRGVVHFDLFLTMGGGIAMSDFYPKAPILRNGKSSRKSTNNQTEQTVTALDIGCNEDYCRGIEGRPDPRSETNPYINLGFGQKFHFANRFHFKVELRNMTLLATDSGFENLVAMWGGFGMRF